MLYQRPRFGVILNASGYRRAFSNLPRSACLKKARRCLLVTSYASKIGLIKYYIFLCVSRRGGVAEAVPLVTATHQDTRTHFFGTGFDDRLPSYCTIDALILQAELFLAKWNCLRISKGHAKRGAAIALTTTACDSSDGLAVRAMLRTLAAVLLLVDTIQDNDFDASAPRRSFCARVLAFISCLAAANHYSPGTCVAAAGFPNPGMREAAALSAVAALAAGAWSPPFGRCVALQESRMRGAPLVIARAYNLAHLLGASRLMKVTSHTCSRVVGHSRDVKESPLTGHAQDATAGSANGKNTVNLQLSRPYSSSHGTAKALLQLRTVDSVTGTREGDALAFIRHNVLAPSLRAQRLHQLRCINYDRENTCKASSCSTYGDIVKLLRRRPLCLSPRALHISICALYDSVLWGNIHQGVQLYRASDAFAAYVCVCVYCCVRNVYLSCTALTCFYP